MAVDPQVVPLLDATNAAAAELGKAAITQVATAAKQALSL